ncbi:ead/Ea22-like family protein [Pseudomonas aeruginosa]|uniref:ead/Ea22-like family protein n=1 Tax=Pseudomonas aeruginosa TaxID=287 RepID=UPI00222F0433|nr:ead/Ea22-like family protein [Pseudomonas aeruginosa]MCW3875225.1 ead/Ea22-like family protein [Pseudomonas aeruginosa]MCW3917692.1 ead/Ea22-like family protein [Pseudomonas aeruginosa]
MDTNKLKELAEKLAPAYQQPWESHRHSASAVTVGAVGEDGEYSDFIDVRISDYSAFDEHDDELGQWVAAANPKTILALLDEIDGLSEELSACTEHPGGCGYWREAAKRRAEERDRLRAQNEALRGALQAVEAEVDGNLRPLTRDLVNMVSGLKNGSHPNDIYEHCDEIERIIDAALEGATQ